MLRMLHECKSRVEGAPSGLAITLDECPLSRKFAYNFTGWLQPADFNQKRGEGLTSDAPTDGRKDPAAAPSDAPDDDDDRSIIPLADLLR